MTLPDRARIPAVAYRDFLNALDGVPTTDEQLRYVKWAEMWDQPTLNAFADIIRSARTAAWSEGYSTALGDFDISARPAARSMNPHA